MNQKNLARAAQGFGENNLARTMPTNVTADYKKAERSFRRAREPSERLACLKEMLRTIPKHKGTEHLQADIKSRIKQLTEELTDPKKGGGRKSQSYTIKPEGAAQVCLLGPPNAGKSSLHARLTGSHTDVGPYAYTTKRPIPGMLAFEDINFQLIDLPPVSTDFMESWFVNALHPAHAGLLIVDLSDPNCLEHVVSIRNRLKEKKVILQEYWPGFSAGNQTGSQSVDPVLGDNDDREISNPFQINLPTLLVANKSDLDPDPDEIKVLEELLQVRFPALATSAETGQGLTELGGMLFKGLNIVRVYTKTPGHPFERDRPFTVRRGDTIRDVARLVHKEIAQSLRFARLWGGGQFEGQQVGPDHLVSDGDIIELHFQQG